MEVEIRSYVGVDFGCSVVTNIVVSACVLCTVTVVGSVVATVSELLVIELVTSLVGNISESVVFDSDVPGREVVFFVEKRLVS